MIKEIEKNYDAFYYMVEAATALSNSPTDEPSTDIKKLVEFIGQSYGFSEELIDGCVKIISEKLPAIGIESDIAGFYATDKAGIDKGDVLLFQTKCDVIHSLQLISRSKCPEINPSWFSYENYLAYSASMRLRELKIVASNGFLAINRLVGMMLFLGIGCSKDKDAGIRRLIQCAYWGDALSLRLLSLAYKELGKKEEEELLKELVSLSPYIQEGITVLPSEIKASEKAKTEFALISSIKQDIVLGLGRYSIDYSFVEIMLLPSIDYRTKMNYINHYQNGDWKEASNPTVAPSKGFGFRIDEE
ncbi:MAG: hypothetical protein K6B65_01910 [Bacilli bacterium]|nr:hypothetical protein [Bacilli bacterium]